LWVSAFEILSPQNTLGITKKQKKNIPVWVIVNSPDIQAGILPNKIPMPYWHVLGRYHWYVNNRDDMSVQAKADHIYTCSCHLDGWCSRRIAVTYSNLDVRWQWAVTSTHRLHYPGERASGTQWTGAAWAQGLVGTLQGVEPWCVDKKNELDVPFCILYFSSNSCSTCFGQPCAHHQQLTTAWCYSLVLVCFLAAGRWSSPVGRYCVHGWVRSTNQHEAITSRSRQLLMMGTWLPETCWATIRREISYTKRDI
jgi:hypothetical protein